MSKEPDLLNDRSRALILGIGNILWADEGFGVRCVERFHQQFRTAPDVLVLDGGTLGAYLLNLIEQTDHLLIFDCVDFHREPGTLQVLRDEQIALWSSTKLSAHQDGLNDVLSIAALQGHLPPHICIVGAQPEQLQDYGGSLTPTLLACLEPAVALGVEQLRAWSIEPVRREPSETVQPLCALSLVQDVYEKQRPSQQEACRDGDIRFALREE